MKHPLPLSLCLLLAACTSGLSQEYSIERHDTLYNSLTVERNGTVVELRARSRGGEYLESAVDLSDPLKLIVPYTHSLFAGMFFEPDPERVLIVGLGGAGFHRLFCHALPEALIHSVELDGKVLELAQSKMGFVPTEKTPVTIMDGRLFVKRNREQWDWIILDAFRGGYVPPHLKTQEFYRECAQRLAPRGVFISNLHATTRLFYSDVKTIASVFPQVVLFRTVNRGNVIAFAVNYAEPAITDPANWAPASEFAARFGAYADFAQLAKEPIPFPKDDAAGVPLLTDDFAPVEFLDVMKVYNTEPD